MKKIRYGLALGSGGAKGIVHIGALQAFFEENIKFDVVCGTSIGSVVAGMYALGFSARQMCGVLKEMDFFSASFMLKAKITGCSLNKILEKIIGERDFAELKLPYAAVATELYTGEQKIIRTGDLCLAMSASCSIPPLFKATYINGKAYVDGAFTNAIPADVARGLGANYVLGIDLTADKPMNFNSLNRLNKLYPKNKVKRGRRNLGGYNFANVILAPDLSKFSYIDFNNSDKFFDIGYKLVKDNIREIKLKLNLPLSYKNR